MKIFDQTLALSGVYLAASLVERMAHKGEVDKDELTLAINSVLNTHPNSVRDLYQPDHIMRASLDGLTHMFDKGSQVKASQDRLRYVMSLLHLSSQFYKRQDVQSQLGDKLEQTKKQRDYFDDSTHRAVIGSLSQAYQETLSTFKFRIQVTGKPDILRQEVNADTVRAVLLFGIRSAHLWRQMGGHRWHLLLQRKKYLDAARTLINRL